jgi:hypothetical protein
MPLLQYFGWVGSFLLAALFAANWCCCTAITPAPGSDIPFDQKINIRIHTDHKWPDRVVLDTTHSTLAREAKADAETDIGRSVTPAPLSAKLSLHSPRWLSPSGLVFDHPAPPAKLQI